MKLIAFGFFLLMGAFLRADESESGYVSCLLEGQLGNQFFEIATSYAYALDHGYRFTVPDVKRKTNHGAPFNAKKIFLAKIDTYDIPVAFETWTEPSFNYASIPDFSAVELKGFFQSEKYFKHRRSDVLALLGPNEEIVSKVLKQYPFLGSGQKVVGIQIRDYRVDRMYGKVHPTIGREFYGQAIAQFPPDTLFFVSSNNKELAKRLVGGFAENVVYEECEDYIDALYALSLCSSFIISNSTFGWWAAWLSEAENKTVIAPNPWFTPPYNNEEMIQDLIPDGWILLEYKRPGKPK